MYDEQTDLKDEIANLKNYSNRTKKLEKNRFNS